MSRRTLTLQRATQSGSAAPLAGRGGPARLNGVGASRLKSAMVIVAALSAAGCGGIQLRSPVVFSPPPYGVEQAAATDAGTPPLVMAPSIGNPAETRIFEEVAELRDEHAANRSENAELRTEMEQARERSEQAWEQWTQARDRLDSELAEVRRTRGEVERLRRDVAALSDDLAEWKQEIATSRRQLQEQHSRDLAALEELNETVSSLVERAEQMAVHSRPVESEPQSQPATDAWRNQ